MIIVLQCEYFVSRRGKYNGFGGSSCKEGVNRVLNYEQKSIQQMSHEETCDWTHLLTNQDDDQ